MSLSRLASFSHQVAVSANWGSFKRDSRAPVKGFGVDTKQIFSLILLTIWLFP